MGAPDSSLALHGLDAAFLIEFDGHHLEAAKPCGVIGRHTVVVEQIPLSFVFCNAVVSSPSDDGFEDDTLVGERSVGIVAHCVAEEMRIARRVREIILAVLLVHP